MAKTAVRIGTRGSPLALAQAAEVKRLLEAAHEGLNAELVPIKTSGDKLRLRPLAEAGGKGLFTKEIEEQLLSGAIDIAVHSAKDLPAHLPEDLRLAAVPVRADAHDALVSKKGASLAALPEGARLGTSSLRRQAQILRLRPDLEVVPLRGNIETRLKKVGLEVDTAILACAGLKRLGLEEAITAILSLDEMLPAPGQGALAIEARAGDEAMKRLLAPLNDSASAAAVTLERAVVAGLGASCTMPLGAFAAVKEGAISARAALFSKNGAICVLAEGEGKPAEAVALGENLAAELKRKAPVRLLKELDLD